LQCSGCQGDNPDGARFCNRCGAALAAFCPRCENPNPSGARFCNACGAGLEATGPEPRDYTPRHLAEKILTQKSALEGERKQVSVLFADVKGSMALAEQLDPEEWHGILDRFFQILGDGVHRFEGTVNQYTGDGIMALFGAPIAHEDHAQRACYAALHIRDRIVEAMRDLKRDRGLQFSARMGINSGEVVVGRIGDDLRMDYTAQGHCVGLAARMVDLASPDTIYLSQASADLVAGYFVLEDLGEFNVKGVGEPVRVCQLDGVGALRTRFDLSRARGLSHFVGRSDEMTALEAALERARQGQGQVVGIVAHAGVGKSRLCFEFLERCRAQGLFATEGRAVPHGENLPLLPVLEAYRAYFSIGERDDPRTVREKIAGRLLLLDEELREALPVVFEFFGVPDPDRPVLRVDPAARRRQLIGVMRRVVQAGGQGAPGITLLEDLHWFDEGSETFLEEWVDALAGTSNLLIVNFRPEYRADWMQSSHYQQTSLQPLGPEAIRELLGHLLGTDPSVEGLADAIHERTRGNPFFTEEAVRTLVEAGQLEGTRGAYRLVTPVEEIRVPESVHVLLAARIDRLPEREKRLLQTAAVIGRSFEEPILEAVAELPEPEIAEALAALRSGEFVHEEALYPVASYAFRHPLTHEVALHSQLSARRRRLHAAVARAIEKLAPDDLDERAALLAHHWEQAEEPLEAARWAARAADRTGVRDAAECLRLWRKVRELAGAAPDADAAIELRMRACLEILNVGGWRMGMPPEEVASLFAEGKRLGEERGDARYLAALAITHAPEVGLASGDVAGYAANAAEIARLVDEAGDPELQATMLVVLGYSHLLVGRIDVALGHSERAAALCREGPSLGAATLGISVGAWGVWYAAYCRALAGDLAGGRAGLEASIRTAREMGEREVLGWALVSLVEVRTQYCGELGDGEALARESLETCEKLGSPFSLLHAHRGMSYVTAFREEWDATVAHLERALAIPREHRTGLEMEPTLLANLAAAHLGAGRTQRAEEIARQALGMGRERGARFSELAALLVGARVLLASGDAGRADEIGATLVQAAGLVADTGFRVFEPQILEARAELAGLRGDGAARQRELREAQRLYAEIGAAGHVQRLARVLGS
jgi:adenylate cyclase